MKIGEFRPYTRLKIERLAAALRKEYREWQE